jgi:DNA-binding CsgD family transcriptional regulator
MAVKPLSGLSDLFAAAAEIHLAAASILGDGILPPRFRPTMIQRVHKAAEAALVQTALRNGVTLQDFREHVEALTRAATEMLAWTKQVNDFDIAAGTKPWAWARGPIAIAELDDVHDVRMSQLMRAEDNLRLLAARLGFKPAPANLRMRRAVRPNKRLTPKQNKAYEVYANHKGNETRAAEELGIARATLQGHVKAAQKKLNVTTAGERQVSARRLPEDRRGQADVVARDLDDD